AEPVTAADNMVHYKAVVKTIAAQNGLYASFMPKPLSGTYGSALTIILSLKKEGHNIFELRDGALSPEGQSFIAGILDHIAEMTMFLNPIVNSYTRLRHSGAPNEINWSFENRGPLIRIPGQVGVHPRIEVRSADCCCNPYISFLLLLAAGMDGIARKLSLSEELHADGTEKPFPTLPATLDEAYEMAKQSDFIRMNLPEEVRRNVYQYTERQLALYHAAEDKAAFEEQHYFLSE
nr:glutamine synthetase [Oscillospiraceae bacterium]